MKKRYLSVYIATAVLLLVAVAGYLMPADSGSPPVRVLLENKGGKVILDHTAHVAVVHQDCGVCHHTSGSSLTPPKCTLCHVPRFDEQFIKTHRERIPKSQCGTCHHALADIGHFSHQDHEESYTDGDCQSCHHHQDIESPQQNCSNCHMDGSNSVPGLRDAAHARCADCHDDMMRLGLHGCRSCHLRQKNLLARSRACTDCHEVPVDKLVPNAMNAFHGRCMGCHERMGLGPHGEDACGQCHMK